MRARGAHPARRAAALWARLLATLALAGGAAQAKVYSEWQPRVGLGAGYDDNILLNASGGDGFGQVLPGLKLWLYGDHGLRSTVDCQVGLSRLMRPDQYRAANGELVMNNLCGADLRTRLDTRWALKLALKTQYAQDPFSITNLGLLLRPGQTSIFYGRFLSDLSYQGSTRGLWLFGVDATSLYFTAGDPGNGLTVAPHVTYEHRTSPRDTVSVGVREQLFFQLGTPSDPAQAALPSWPASSTGEATTAQLGYRRRLNEITELQITAGPTYLRQPTGGTFQPMARIDLEAATPTAGVHVTLSHDLVLGPSRAGPLVGDLAEVIVSGPLVGPLVGHVRGGVYRNQLPASWELGTVGYSAGAGLDYRLGRAWTLGASVARDARLNGDAIEHTVDRDVMQMRLTWEMPRDW